MLSRFVTFVDGSNLDGTLTHLGVRVDDYGELYRYIFEQAVGHWGQTFAQGSNWPTAQHSRIYWYVVGKMDEWDLDHNKTQDRLRYRYDNAHPKVHANYLADVPGDCPAEDRYEQAFQRYYSETRKWYDNKLRALERKKRFYHGVQSTTDFVEIRQDGHWKVDLLYHSVDEKGLDTSMAVDVVALQSTYDVALLITGDADGIPGVTVVKNNGKHVGIAEFHKGAQATNASKGSSNRLKIVSDFVVPVYESELVDRELAYRADVPEFRSVR